MQHDRSTNRCRHRLVRARAVAGPSSRPTRDRCDLVEEDLHRPGLARGCVLHRPRDRRAPHDRLLGPFLVRERLGRSQPRRGPPGPLRSRDHRRGRARHLVAPMAISNDGRARTLTMTVLGLVLQIGRGRSVPRAPGGSVERHGLVVGVRRDPSAALESASWSRFSLAGRRAPAELRIAADARTASSPTSIRRRRSPRTSRG